MDRPVPEVLRSGHHKNIDTWRRQKSIERTLERRPDLLEGAVLSKKEQKYLEELLEKKRQEQQNKTETVETEETVNCKSKFRV